MRAVAVLLVVIGHAGLGHIVPGGSGVTIFFAVSGFIITTLLLKEREKTADFDIGGFYVRRAVKLMPPLVVVLIVPTLIYALLGGSINWNAFSGQIFFYFNWIKLDHPDVFPGSAVVWSLSIEEQFYIVFALLWLGLVKSRRATLWLTALAATVILTSTTLRLYLADPGNELIADRIYYGSDTRADSLAWGIVAAVALRQWQKSNATPSRLQRFSGSDLAFIGAILVFLASLVIRDDWFRQTFRYTVQSVATCILVLYGFAASGTTVRRMFNGFCRMRIVQDIGLASYSIYLVHLSIMMFAARFTDSLPLPVAVGIETVLSVGCGIALFRIVEVPARRQYEKLRDRRNARRQVPVYPA